MSSTTVSILESNRTTVSFSYFMFVFIVFLLSIRKVPDFSSLTILFGIFFFVSLITAIFAILGLFSRVQVWISGIKTKNIWIGIDRDLLVQNNIFALHMDTLTGELFFGSGTFFLGLLIAFKGNDVIGSVFGSEYILNNILSIYGLSLIGIILSFIALFIVYQSWIKGKKNTLVIWDLLELIRMRRYPRPHDLDHPFNKWIDKLSSLAQNRYFQLFHDELSALLYIRIEKIIDDSSTLISGFISDQNMNTRVEFDYPYFTLNITGLSQTHNQFNKTEKDVPIKTAALSKLFDFDILDLNLQLPEILFAPNSEFNPLIIEIRKKTKKFISFDFIFFHISWIYFYACLKVEKQISPSHKSTLLPIDNLDIKMTEIYDINSITFTILYSTWLVYNSFSLEQESQNIPFYYDTTEAYTWKHFKPDPRYIKLLKDNSNKTFKKLIYNISISLNGKMLQLQDIYSELIKQFKDMSKKDYTWAVVYNSSLEKLVDILEKSTYNEFLTFFQIERKVDIEKLVKTINSFSKEYTHIAKSIPWK